MATGVTVGGQAWLAAGRRGWQRGGCRGEWAGPASPSRGRARRLRLRRTDSSERAMTRKSKGARPLAGGGIRDLLSEAQGTAQAGSGGDGGRRGQTGAPAPEEQNRHRRAQGWPVRAWAGCISLSPSGGIHSSSTTTAPALSTLFITCRCPHLSTLYRLEVLQFSPLLSPPPHIPSFPRSSISHSHS